MTSSLPLPTVPSYSLELPISKKRIRYRPFLVKEEKILLVASEMNDSDQLIDAINQVLELCTYGEVAVRKLPVADAEFLFVKIREQSIGGSIPGTIECKACGNTQDYVIDIPKVSVENNVKDNVIKLSDTTYITMKFPTLETGKGLGQLQGVDIPLSITASMVESITVNDRVFDAADLPKADIMNWLEHCTEEQVNLISDFLESLPKVVYRDKCQCKKCGDMISVYVEGIEPFFS